MRWPGCRSNDHAVLTGGTFFPTLISGSFRDGLHAAFIFAIVACLIAAPASLMRGGHPAHDDDPALASVAVPRRPLAAELKEQHAH